MKICLSFSGQPRFVEKGFEKVKTFILDKYNCDVVCHAWKSKDNTYETSSWSGLPERMEISNNVFENIKTLYNPVKYAQDFTLTDEYIDSKLRLTENTRTKYNLYSMYTSMQRSYKLIENKNDYDWIVRIRYDLNLSNFLDLSELDPDYIYFVDYSHLGECIVSNNLFITSPKHSDFMFNIVEHIDDIYESGCIFNDEEIVKTYIINNGYSEIVKAIPYEFFYDSLDDILRS